MSASNAEEYADSIAQGIQRMTDQGSPFGWIHTESGEWSDTEPEGWGRPFWDGEDAAEAAKWAEASTYDYLSDALDIEYRVTSDAQYRSAEILISFGGPNAWIDTKTGLLVVTWWSEPVTRPLPQDFIDGLDDAAEELWQGR